MTSQELQSLKNKYDIIGNDPALNRALEIAVKVAPVDMTVLVSGESGVGKENIPKIIHQNSPRRRAKYFAINCGAIPEGTIDSELFGHEKGSFTGANEMRRGYFEEADGGTIFLDEIAELPMASQAKLLRVLQSGEFIRVGSSKVLRTDVRVIAATNVNLMHAVSKGKFRADLYYRLNAVVIPMPALRERPADINVLFRKFASDVAVQYRMPAIRLDDEAREVLQNYYWRGNIRQLKNVAEQISAIEQSRLITADVLRRYLPDSGHSTHLAAGSQHTAGQEFANERELLYKLLFDMRAEIGDLKRMVAELMHRAGAVTPPPSEVKAYLPSPQPPHQHPTTHPYAEEEFASVEEVEEMGDKPRTKDDVLREQIIRALRRNGGRRRETAKELFMSERTLYRKIKDLGIDE